MQVGCIKGVGKLSEAFNFTHAVHMRFSSADHVTRFLADQVFLPKTMKQGDLWSACCVGRYA